MKSRGKGVKANLDSQTVVLSACKLMAKHGFHAVSFQMIADDLGVSQSTVMHYFKNRTALIQAILSHGVQSNLGIVTKMIQIQDSALTRLWKYFSGTLAWTRMRPEEASIVLYLYYIGSVEPDFSELYRQMLSRARNRVLEFILAAERESAIHLRMPAEIAAEILHDNLLASLVNLIATGNQKKPAKDTETKWKKLVESILLPREGWDKSF